jgi:hypothetical protein
LPERALRVERQVGVARADLLAQPGLNDVALERAEALQAVFEIARRRGDRGRRRVGHAGGARTPRSASHRGEKRGRPHQRHDHLPADVIRRDDAQPPEQPAADDGAEAPHHQIAEDAELAATAHDGQHEPARAQPGHRPRQQLPHSILLN